MDAEDVVAGGQRLEDEPAARVGRRHGGRDAERRHHRARKRAAPIVADASRGCCRARLLAFWFVAMNLGSVWAYTDAIVNPDDCGHRCQEPGQACHGLLRSVPLRDHRKVHVLREGLAWLASLSVILISSRYHPSGKTLERDPLPGLDAAVAGIGSNAAPIVRE